MKPHSREIHLPESAHVYLVGGAVRDTLLKYPSHEKDYVVVGSTPEAMLEAGFLPVGKSFPVFLHPKTKEEYALARSEKKVAKGYHGFEFYTDPSVTLEEDLLRRDLTINAIAMDEDGRVIDPYGGQRDLAQKLLRHVSDAFVEDPVRILRIARFAARFHHLGFSIAPETLELMREMVNAGEVDALVAERVWKETEKAFEERNPEVYIAILRDCGALAILMPALNEVLKTEAAARMAALQTICAQPLRWDNGMCAALRFAVLAHGIAMHSSTFPPQWEVFLDMYASQEKAISQWATIDANGLLEMLNGLDAFRREPRFLAFLDIVSALFPPQARQHFQTAYEIADAVPIQSITQSLTGLAIKEAIHDARVKAIDAWLKSR